MAERKSGGEFKHIVRIAATEIDGSRPLRLALRAIKGVSWSFSNAVIRALDLDPRKPIGSYPEDILEKIEDCLKNPAKYGIPSWLYNRRKDLLTGKDMHLVGPDWEFQVKQDIEFLKNIKAYRGIRHAFGLRVRGQRTRSTGRRGRTVGVQRKKK